MLAATSAARPPAAVAVAVSVALCCVCVMLVGSTGVQGVRLVRPRLALRPKTALDVSPVFVEMQKPNATAKGHVTTKNCDKCEWIKDEPKVVRESFSNADKERWAENTGEKAKNIIHMLSYYDDHKLPDEQKVADNIKESQMLLHLYDKLKSRLVDVLNRRTGVSIRLPSEHPDFVDATGKHWEDAEMRDNVDKLARDFNKDAKKDAKALKAEMDRTDVNMSTPNSGGGSATVQVVPLGTLSKETAEAHTTTTANHRIANAVVNTGGPLLASSSCNCACHTVTCPCACVAGYTQQQSAKGTPEGYGADQSSDKKRIVAHATVAKTVQSITGESIHTVPSHSLRRATDKSKATAAASSDPDCQPPLCMESTSISTTESSGSSSSSGPNPPPSETPTSKLKSRLQKAIHKAISVKKINK